ncbi:MAG TPA: HD domain-containing phosphohydrolase [Desulfuromonadaceae bacterium]
MNPNVKRLLKKGAVLRTVDDLCDGRLVLVDTDGTTLYGPSAALDSGCPGTGGDGLQPVLLEGEIVCHVTGTPKAASAAALLSATLATDAERRDLVRETLSKYREINLLYDVTEKLAASLDPHDVADLAIGETLKMVPADHASMMIFDDKTGYLQTIAEVGAGIEPKGIVEIGKGISGNVITNGKAEIVNDVLSDSRYVAGGASLRSLMCAPLRLKDRVMGVINVGRSGEGGFTAEELKLLSAVTLQTASAIENARLYDTLKETFLTSVYTLAETIEMRDPYTGGHTKRVMEYSLAIGRALALDDAEQERLRLAAALHDVGKIGVRDCVLLKNGKLTDEEFDEIRKHPLHGENILKYIKYFAPVIPGVKQHHERYDGKGYPDGLKGEEIDLIARIIAVGDTYDAMTTDRPYRRGLEQAVALQEIRRCSGAQFDPAVVEAFLGLWRGDGF